MSLFGLHLVGSSLYVVLVPRATNSLALVLRGPLKIRTDLFSL